MATAGPCRDLQHQLWCQLERDGIKQQEKLEDGKLDKTVVVLQKMQGELPRGVYVTRLNPHVHSAWRSGPYLDPPSEDRKRHRVLLEGYPVVLIKEQWVIDADFEQWRLTQPGTLLAQTLPMFLRQRQEGAFNSAIKREDAAHVQEFLGFSTVPPGARVLVECPPDANTASEKGQKPKPAWQLRRATEGGEELVIAMVARQGDLCLGWRLPEQKPGISAAKGKWRLDATADTMVAVQHSQRIGYTCAESQSILSWHCLEVDDMAEVALLGKSAGSVTAAVWGRVTKLTASYCELEVARENQTSLPLRLCRRSPKCVLLDVRLEFNAPATTETVRNVLAWLGTEQHLGPKGKRHHLFPEDFCFEMTPAIVKAAEDADCNVLKFLANQDVSHFALVGDCTEASLELILAAPMLGQHNGQDHPWQIQICWTAGALANCLAKCFIRPCEPERHVANVRVTRPEGSMPLTVHQPAGPEGATLMAEGEPDAAPEGFVRVRLNSTHTVRHVAVSCLESCSVVTVGAPAAPVPAQAEATPVTAAPDAPARARAGAAKRRKPAEDQAPPAAHQHQPWNLTAKVKQPRRAAQAAEQPGEAAHSAGPAKRRQANAIQTRGRRPVQKRPRKRRDLSSSDSVSGSNSSSSSSSSASSKASSKASRPTPQPPERTATGPDSEEEALEQNGEINAPEVDSLDESGSR